MSTPMALSGFPSLAIFRYVHLYVLVSQEYVIAVSLLSKIWKQNIHLPKKSTFACNSYKTCKIVNVHYFIIYLYILYIFILISLNCVTHFNYNPQIIARKEQLYELGQAWSQVKLQTESLISQLLRYKEKCDDYSRSKVIRAASHQLTDFSHMLRECENKHEDMRLLNNRQR